jgi:hypothetical protein
VKTEDGDWLIGSSALSLSLSLSRSGLSGPGSWGSSPAGRRGAKIEETSPKFFSMLAAPLLSEAKGEGGTAYSSSAVVSEGLGDESFPVVEPSGGGD